MPGTPPGALPLLNREAVLAELVREGFDELADHIFAAACEAVDLRDPDGLGDRLRRVRWGLPGEFARCVRFRALSGDGVQAVERARNEFLPAWRDPWSAGGVSRGEMPPLGPAFMVCLAAALAPLAGEFGSMQERIDFARGVVDPAGVPTVDVFQ